MPKATAKKTVSAPKLTKRILLVSAAVLSVLAIAGFIAGKTSAPGSRPLLIANGKTFHLETTDEPAEKQRGLSGRTHLPADSAMLFTYDQPGEYCFWMKDMLFPIDIVWLDADKKVIAIKPNADPSTYPQRFCPDSPAQYVLEFVAGTAQNLNLSIGQTMAFSK